MRIDSVFDESFRPYGQVVAGLEGTVEELLAVLAGVPRGAGVDYVPTDPALQELPAAQVIRDHCFGGMPVQLGWCSGHNTRLNCLEYHRDSEFNLGTEDFTLLLAKREEMEQGTLDTTRVRAFRVPAGVLVELYATTLHYAPCHCDGERGFRVLVALPWMTNTPLSALTLATEEDSLLTARNKWLLAHPESDEARNGAKIGLRGENIDLALLL